MILSLPWSSVDFLPFKFVKDFIRAQKIREELRHWDEYIFTHIQRLDENKELLEGGLAQAILDFSRMEGITKADVLQEIRTMFIAGNIHIYTNT